MSEDTPTVSSLEELHRGMVDAQIEALEFYIEKYEGLAEMCRAMKFPALASILDGLVVDAMGALAATASLLDDPEERTPN